MNIWRRFLALFDVREPVDETPPAPDPQLHGTHLSKAAAHSEPPPERQQTPALEWINFSQEEKINTYRVMGQKELGRIVRLNGNDSPEADGCSYGLTILELATGARDFDPVNCDQCKALLDECVLAFRVRGSEAGPVIAGIIVEESPRQILSLIKPQAPRVGPGNGMLADDTRRR